MKQLILDKIEELDGNVSFVDLEEIPGFYGDEHLGMPEHNCAYWINVSEAVARAIHELVKDGMIEIEPTPVQTYMIDGCTLPLPLYDGDESDDLTKWLPVVLNKGSRFYQDQEEQVA